MENQPKEPTKKMLINKIRSYKKKRDKARASRINRLKKQAIGNKNEITSLNGQVNRLKKTMTQTYANNKLLKRYDNCICITYICTCRHARRYEWALQLGIPNTYYLKHGHQFV